MKSFKEFISEELKQIGTQQGFNPGGVHVDTKTNERFYIKHYKNPDQARTEVLAGKIYSHMGIPTHNSEIHGSSSIISKFNPDAKDASIHELTNLKPHQANQMGKIYHAAILTKNWDVIGKDDHESNHNVQINHKTGDLHSLDQGGSFSYGGAGGHKDYSHDISEKQSFRNMNTPAAKVFNATFKAYPSAEAHGLEAVKKIDDNHIHSLFKNSGIKNWEQHHETFKARKSALIKSYE